MENKTIHTMIVNVENSTFTVTPPLDIHQSDRNSHILLIKLCNNNNKFISIDEDVTYKIFFYRSSDETLIESEDVKIENYYRGILSHVLGPTVMSDFGKYTCTLRGYLDDEIISSISFPITVSKDHNYTAKSNEIAMTKEFYNELNEHMDDTEIHLQEIDRDFIDTFNDQVDALLKTIRDNEFVKELKLNSTPKDITSLSQGVYLVLTEGEIKLPASDLDDQSIPVSTTLSKGSVIYVNGSSYNVISDKESYSVSKVRSTGFYKYKLSLDEKTKRGILKDIEDLKKGKQGSLTPGDGIDIDESTGEISVDDTITRVENVNKSLDKKVDKVEGKQLSTNDYTDEDMEKVRSLVTEIDVMVFKGTIGEGGTPGTLPSEYKVGYSYKVITAGTYAGNTCEVGDMLIAISVSNPISDSDWTVIQSNIDGAVTAKFSTSDIGKIPVVDESNTLIATSIDPTTLASKTDLANSQTSLTEGYQAADTALKTDLESKITTATPVWETLS